MLETSQIIYLLIVPNKSKKKSWQWSCELFFPSSIIITNSVWKDLTCIDSFKNFHTLNFSGVNHGCWQRTLHTDSKCLLIGLREKNFQNSQQPGPVIENWHTTYWLKQRLRSRWKGGPNNFTYGNLIHSFRITSDFLIRWFFGHWLKH